ncbi:MADS-box protein AeAP3-2-like isoform X2 [Asparagus officinalis]|nr:MADS-box protein AeAP3-2-like isoform X2 [Asparagus officinalis]
MGRGKIEIKKIENPTNRQVTFSKRRGGLLKKAHELAILCDAQVGVIVFSSSGKMFEYCNPPLSMHHIIERYQRATNVRFDDIETHHQQLFLEITRMRNEADKLQASMRKFNGEDLTTLTLNDLNQLEDQLEYSLNKVRTRKHQLMHQQLDNLRRKEHLLEDQNTYLYRALSEHQASMEHQTATDHKVGEIAMLEHFGNLYQEEGPRNVLQLAPQLHTFRLQPMQPNLQEDSLQGSGLQL